MTDQADGRASHCISVFFLYSPGLRSQNLPSGFQPLYPNHLKLRMFQAKNNSHFAEHT